MRIHKSILRPSVVQNFPQEKVFAARTPHALNRPGALYPSRRETNGLYSEVNDDARGLARDSEHAASSNSTCLAPVDIKALHSFRVE